MKSSLQAGVTGTATHTVTVEMSPPHLRWIAGIEFKTRVVSGDKVLSEATHQRFVVTAANFG